MDLSKEHYLGKNFLKTIDNTIVNLTKSIIK